MTVEKLRELLRKAWSRETSADSENWSPENPAWGQCAVTALVVQDFFGGELVRGKAKCGIILYSHYWNRLPNGQECDFTKEQFPKNVEVSEGEPKSKIRDYVLSYPETRKRYASLRLAVENLIQPNSLLTDETYRLCFEAAQTSECQKMKFGCVAIYTTPKQKKEKIIAATSNKTIEPLRHLCEPECIRMKIQSRTESMIGACGHAEEWALQEIFKRKINPALCSLYIAGFDAKTSSPWIKKEAADHTCLRCAVQMHMAGLGKIWVPFIDCWESLTPEEAVKKSAAYALKEKKI